MVRNKRLRVKDQRLSSRSHTLGMWGSKLELGYLVPLPPKSPDFASESINPQWLPSHYLSSQEGLKASSTCWKLYSPQACIVKISSFHIPLLGWLKNWRRGRKGVAKRNCSGKLDGIGSNPNIGSTIPWEKTLGKICTGTCGVCWT